MKVKLSLTKQYLLFLTIVIVLLIVTSLVITSYVVESGLSDLFQQRMVRANEVLRQYSEARYLSKANKFQTVLTSPRFIATVATADEETINQEVNIYKEMLGTDIFVVTENNGRLIYSSNINDSLVTMCKLLIAGGSQRRKVNYCNHNGQIYEIFMNRIITADGYQMGWLIAGEQFSNQVALELRNLTGFEIIVSQEENILGFSASELTDRVIKNQDKYFAEFDKTNLISETSFLGDNILYFSSREPFSNAKITFLTDIDQQLSPIINKIGMLLTFLSISGAILALLAIYIFTDRRIGRQVSYLVNAAEKIAEGNLQTEIIPQSNDELGFLAGEFEKMRFDLLENRMRSEKAHRDKLNSERLAAVGQMATGIIHDFKSPMAVIRGHLDLIIMKYGDNRQIEKYCNIMQSQIDRMLDMTTDVIEFSSGQSKLEKEVVDLKKFMIEIMKFHLDAFENRNLEITIKGEQQVYVSIDPKKFRRIIDNILNNAREALSSGEKVEIDWKIKNSDLSITITDNGPGIPSEILNNLFDPFITSGKEGGTGLGLAISKKIVKDHGGEIDVSSAENVGTIFEIIMPSHSVKQNEKSNLVV